MTEKKRFQNTLQSIVNDEEQPVKELEEVRKFYQTGDASARLKQYNMYDKGKAYRKFQMHTNKRNQRKVFHRILYVAAAAVILMVVVIPFFNNQDIPTHTVQQIGVPILSDSLPRIKLANGEIIEIADTCNSLSVGGIHATIKNNTINIDGSSEVTAVQMNEIIIPRGRQYSITLPDGTKVWMNSETSLKFPNRFTEYRDVQLKGQAFFEVVKDGRPFRVNCSEGTVTVLGTSFDVKNYEDEPTQVTLVTGIVKFKDSREEVTLQPGQQACQTDEGIEVSDVDTYRFTAWKEGLIYFDNSLEYIMRSIERIYDVKVVYNSCEQYKQLRFVVQCSRYQTIDEFMQLLNLTQEFNYEINENIVIIK
ncbi:MAG: FecR domain-containing protein [Bacteroidales bacterium]|nr:FecR domain-containing protein [Bacteroidales bacterium]MDD2424972.1 FecR domain-containing protein [Bacteroidales bacterium]MDD3989205.1 FecR domain-containing protein [Bacteroidales bacterium]